VNAGLQGIGEDGIHPLFCPKGSRYSAAAANSEFCAVRFSTFGESGEPSVGDWVEAAADAAGEQGTTAAEARKAD
jgi:hypothetical protein